MTYSTTWYHLDKNGNKLAEYIGRACFSNITSGPHNFEEGTQYLEYDFSVMKVTQEEAKDYFLFLKSIPEFKELMPRSCVGMAKTQRYRVDLHKYNGTKIFTMLTLVRAVVEDPKIVRAVLQFDHKFKYSLSNFSILKMCGSMHQENSNHWITSKVDKSNLPKMFNNRLYWDDPVPCIKTGLGRNIFNTFLMDGDGFAVRNRITSEYMKQVKEEKGKKKVVKQQKQYDNTVLQLGF